MTDVSEGTPVRSREYSEVQRRLSTGWNTWDTRSVLAHVRLPDGVGIRLGLKEYYRGLSLHSAQIGRREDGVEDVTLGPHAVDGTYTEVTVSWQGVTVRVRTAHDGDDLVVLVEPLQQQVKPALLTVSLGYAWGLPGVVSETDGALEARSESGVVTVHATSAAVWEPYSGVDGPHLCLPMAEAVGLSTGRRRTVEEIRGAVERAHARLERETDGVHAEIVRDAVAWNTMYEPAKGRVVTMVSRLWNVQKRGGYALFCWDAFFGALLAGTVSPDLAAANVLEMLAEATAEGFVPNVAQGTGRTTLDGSQPPFASVIAWELATALDMPWLLRDSFDALLAWNRWWWRVRRSGDLLSLGSTWFEPEAPSPQDIPRIHQHFGATCESGADDHPVFADVPFDTSTSLLRAHDIGLNSEYALDCEYLARIADALGKGAEGDELRARREHVVEQVRTRLWDDDAGIYRSHFTDTGAPTASLSPMSFYPMLAGIPTAPQVEQMVTGHLENPSHFGGEWTIPVTPRTDPSTAVQSYWSGRIWPPVNFLVYLGLLRTGRRDAASRLARRSADLVLKEWRENRHVHENYSSVTGAGCDVPNSEPFLTWGGLLALIQLIEDGQTALFTAWTKTDERWSADPHPSPAPGGGHTEGA